MTRTRVERCVGKQEGGRVGVNIESPVVHGKQPVLPPLADRGELEKLYHMMYRMEKCENNTSKYTVWR